MAQRQRPEPAAGLLPIFGAAIALMGICVGFGLLIEPWIGLANLAFIFLLPVVMLAGRHGLAAGLLTAAVATISFNFFFVPPTWTLHIANLDNAVTLGVFALIAIAVSQFASRLRAQAARAERLAEESAMLAQLSQDLSGIHEEANLFDILQSRLSDWTGAHVNVLARSQIADGTVKMGPLDQSAAQWAISHHEAAGRGLGIMGGADGAFLPLDIGEDDHWLVQFWRGDTLVPLSPDVLLLAQHAIRRTGDALYGARIARHQSELEARQQQNAMREALLASLSHDLRTPLTSIRAGLDALEPDAGGLVASTRAEAVRLERMVANLLDLARLRANALLLDLSAIDLTDVVDAATEAMSVRLADHPLSVSIDADLPLVRSDARLLHHMLINILENACKYSPAGEPIKISVKQSVNGVVLSVTDQGLGLPDPVSGDIFSPFQRGANADQVAGSGLGLAVVEGFARALGVTVSAANVPDTGGAGPSGATFSIRFPPQNIIAESSEI